LDKGYEVNKKSIGLQQLQQIKSLKMSRLCTCSNFLLAVEFPTHPRWLGKRGKLKQNQTKCNILGKFSIRPGILMIANREREGKIEKSLPLGIPMPKTPHLNTLPRSTSRNLLLPQKPKVYVGPHQNRKTLRKHIASSTPPKPQPGPKFSTRSSISLMYSAIRPFLHVMVFQAKNAIKMQGLAGNCLSGLPELISSSLNTLIQYLGTFFGCQHLR